MKDNQAKYPQLRFKGFTDPWVQRKLTDVGDIARGKSKHRPRNDKKLFGGKYPFVQTGDVASAGLFLTNYSQTYNEFGLAQSKLWPSGTLLITIAANIAETSILGIDAAFPDSVIGFTAKNSDVVFIKTLIDKFSNGLKRKAETSSQANLNLAKLSDLDIVVPNYDEQKQISSFFQNLDNLIAANQRKLDLLKEQKKGYLQKMFPKNGAKVPELRFAGFADAWEQRKLGELGKIYTGNTPKTSDLDNWTDNKEGHIWITPTDIDKLIMSDSDRHLSEQGWSKARKIPENSVLITSIASIGKNTINAVPVAFNQQINAIVPEKNDSYFILSAMIKDTARFASVAGQTATAIINKTTFEKFQIATPSYEEQQKIGSFFKQLDNTITLHQRKLEKLQELKKGYLQKMFC
ncbi:restriction endonuclease subunit S [Lactiplantibacillus plantarum]|uniref:restriction endonuclease subunit S n=1 Tax=Lactiplantibacillus plantarum TaxID=1590 RepID=UPI002F269455